MTTGSNNVVELMRSAGGDFKNANPNTGHGGQGEWPPDGIHTLTIVDTFQREGSVYDGDAKVKCVEIGLVYEWEPKPEDPGYVPGKPPLTFEGHPFYIVGGGAASLKTDKGKEKVQKELDRLLGHAVKLLNADENTLKGDLAGTWQRMETTIKGEFRISAAVNCRYFDWETPADAAKGRTARKGTTKKEYIQENLSVAPAEPT